MSSAERSRKASPEYRALQQKWTDCFHCPPPLRISANFLQLATAWHEQMQASDTWCGKAGMNRLQKLLRTKPKSRALNPGTRLVRQWQGQTHQVTVLDQGFEYAGLTYPSLSAIARQITGTPWSGPLFFGLKS